jgi:hypothetical protein
VTQLPRPLHVDSIGCPSYQPTHSLELRTYQHKFCDETSLLKISPMIFVVERCIVLLASVRRTLTGNGLAVGALDLVI